MEWLLITAALIVAFSNGANDNFKGFATVWGSDTLSYRQALSLATVATVAGSLASLMLAESLAQQFSGKGLVPDAVVNGPLFILSVGSGAAVTVCLATRIGFPVSTTHALIGGLVGAGLAQNVGELHFARLASAFLLPLLVSPIVAAAMGMLAYRMLRWHAAGKDCACLVAPALMPATDGTLLSRMATPNIVLDSDTACARLEAPVRISVLKNMDRLHVFSGMSICFARGVNDTPKLTALLVAAQVLNAEISIGVIGIAMAAGGILFGKQVADTMSQRLTRMDHAQGLAANLITAALVLFASKLGMPVSTTHVAVGSIAGVGASAKTINWHSLRNVLLSWVVTLPLALVVAAGVSQLFRAVR